MLVPPRGVVTALLLPDEPIKSRPEPLNDPVSLKEPSGVPSLLLLVMPLNPCFILNMRDPFACRTQLSVIERGKGEEPQLDPQNLSFILRCGTNGCDTLHEFRYTP